MIGSDKASHASPSSSQSSAIDSSNNHLFLIALASNVKRSGLESLEVALVRYWTNLVPLSEPAVLLRTVLYVSFLFPALPTYLHRHRARAA